jgi:hypothetical protein
MALAMRATMFSAKNQAKGSTPGLTTRGLHLNLIPRYEGHWLDNSISGKGIYIWSDERRYEGEWLNNNMHGKGVYTWKDGRRYEGEYFNDKKHGFGGKEAFLIESL